MVKAKNGFKLLTMIDIGWVYWFSTDPVYTPSDLKKQKFGHGLEIIRLCSCMKKMDFSQFH